MMGINSKIFIKNDRIFLRLFMVKGNQFLQPILKVRKELGLPKLKLKQWTQAFFEEKYEDDAWDKIFGWLSVYRKQSGDFFNNLPPDKRNNLISEIEKLRINNSLGREWFTQLLDFIITGFFIPPYQNFYLETDEFKKEISIKLNPDTTIEDLKDSWSIIKKAQEKVFGKMKRTYATSKSAENLILYAKAEEQKKKKLKDELTGKKYKPKDIDVIGQLSKGRDELTSSEQDTKQVQRLRQIRSRLKNKLNK